MVLDLEHYLDRNIDVANLGTLLDDKDGARLGTLLDDKDGVRLGTLLENKIEHYLVTKML